MRYIYQGHFKDQSGNVVASGQITVYEANSTTLATIYSAESGGSAVSGSVVTTDSAGFFSFYIDTLDYNADQRFKIKLEKTGFASQTYDYIQIYPEYEYVYYASASATDQGVDGNDNSLKDLLTEIGTSDLRTIVLKQGTYTVSTNLTVTSNITLKIQSGALFSVANGVTLTISGRIETGIYQIFSGAGTVTGLSFAYPEWWGIDGTADEVEINKAILAVGSYGYVKNGSKAYTTAATIAMTGAAGVEVTDTVVDLSGAIITCSHTGAGLTIGNSDDATGVAYCTVKIGRISTTSTGLSYGIKEVGTSTSHNTIIVDEIGSDAIKNNSMGICQMAANIGNYYNIYIVRQIVKFAVHISNGYDFSTATAATEASNRTYFFNTHMAHYNQYGIYVYNAHGNEYYGMDFAGGTGVAATTIDLYLAYIDAGHNATGNKFFGYSESGNDVFVHLDNSAAYNVVDMRGISLDLKVDDDNTDENNFLFVGKEFRTESIWVDQLYGGNGTGNITAYTAFVADSSFGCSIGTLADSATPSVNGKSVWLTGGTTTITDLTGGGAGQIIIIISEHNIKITDGTNIFLNGSADYDMNATDTLTLICKADLNWYELARGNNST